jgi:hypothetical protein
MDRFTCINEGLGDVVVTKGKAIKTYGEGKYSSIHSQPHGGEWLASRPGSFTLATRKTRLGGLREGGDALEKEKISCLYRESNHAPSVV